MGYSETAGAGSPPLLGQPPVSPSPVTAGPGSLSSAGTNGIDPGGFARSQQAGLNAIFRLAGDGGRSRVDILPVRSVQVGAARAGIFVRPVAVPDTGPIIAKPEPAAARDAAAPDDSTERSGRFRHLPPLALMVVILTVQVALSVRYLRADTAFGDEALYLWAGHLEWAHWLHGTSIPAFPTWFSGSPVIYPPIGAMADHLGGLLGARLLSLAFMLGATLLLWATAARLFGRPAAFFAAGLFAVIGPTLHLSAFATYDPMTLFLLALAAWCACGARTSEDATGWIAASGVVLVLANATKYASALFDPVVIVMATLCAYPKPGGKAALRRGTLLLTIVCGGLAVLLRLGGSWYLAGIGQTTVLRPNGGEPVTRVLADSWEWTAVVLVAALAGIMLSIARRRGRVITCLITVLLGAALLVPIEQARVQTTVSLDKHVDFGAWFACIAGGYALALLTSWPRPRLARMAAAVCFGAGLVPVASVGASQAQDMVNWPGASALISFLKPLTGHGGRFLAETDDVPEYYLPDTSWRQWSNTFSITLPGGKIWNVHGDPALFAHMIDRHYFSVVVLSFAETPVMDQAITRALAATPGYRVIGIVPYGQPVPGNYTVWAFRPRTLKSTP